MTLSKKLKTEQNKKLENHAIEVAIEIEPRILKSAQQGYSALEIKLEDREDAHILINPSFLKKLRDLLDGCEIEIKSYERTNLLFKNKYLEQRLKISWQK